MGLLFAFLILILWIAHLVYCLAFLTVDFFSPYPYIHMIVQAYLYTGLFITGHDAMHGTVSRNKGLNRAIGFLCARTPYSDVTFL